MEHQVGDRRNYFRAPENSWQIFQTLAQERMREMHDLIELATGWFAETQRMDQATLKTLMKMGTSVQKVLDFKLVGSNAAKKVE